jgi:hypothetical protein
MQQLQLTENEKADLLGERLVKAVGKSGCLIIEELAKTCRVCIRDKSRVPQWVVELAVYYMHFVHRLAFVHLGRESGESFCGRFNEAVKRALLRTPSPGISSGDLAELLHDTYNRRQPEYARYVLERPGKNAPLAGTLFWEFTKILMGFLSDQSPAIVFYVSSLVATTTVDVIQDEMEVKEVLLT